MLTRTTVACAATALTGTTTTAADFFIADGDEPALIAAINTANANGVDDTIHLASNGVYSFSFVDNSVFGPSALPLVFSTITIEGNGAEISRGDVPSTPEMRLFAISSSGDLTINDATIELFAITSGSSVGGAIRSQGGTLTLNGSTLTRNTSSIAGGAVYSGAGGTLDISDCTISLNTGGQGAGVYSFDSDTTIDGCWILENTGISGGGMTNIGDSAIAVVTDTMFLENHATSTQGGGINNAGALTLNGCEVNDGSSVTSGGGVYNSGSLTVVGGSIRNNSAPEVGSGLANEGATASTDITGCNIDDNSGALNGAGVHNTGGLTMTDCSVSGNTVPSVTGIGGGIFTDAATPVVLTRCTISGNTSGGAAGGIDHNGGSLTITECSFITNNATTQTAGAISSSGTELRVERSTFSTNSAQLSAGALSAGSDATTVVNSTFSGNTAGTSGGAIAFVSGADGSLTHCTLYANAANALGAGILVAGVGPGTVTLSNTIVAGSTGSTDISGSYTDEGFNIIEDGSGITHTESFSADPMLGSLSANGGPTQTHLPASGSPATDAGDCHGGTVLIDQRSTDRPQGLACDIGAVEVLEAPCPADLAAPFGVLNFFDLGAFLTLFNAQDPAADFAAPFGVWNFFDLGEFLTLFNQGCP